MCHTGRNICIWPSRGIYENSILSLTYFDVYIVKTCFNITHICCIYTYMVCRIKISHLTRKSILSVRWPQLGPGLTHITPARWMYTTHNPDTTTSDRSVPNHPASGFKTAFDLDLLSRGQVMLCQRFNAHIFDWNDEIASKNRIFLPEQR